jgi:hypothetical protein
MRFMLLGVLAALAAGLAAPAAARGQERGEPTRNTVLVYVVDRATGTPLPGAVVELPELERRAIANAEGRTLLAGLPPGNYMVRVRLLGYQEFQQKVRVPERSTVVTVALGPRPIVLEGVTAYGFSIAEELARRRYSAGISVRVVPPSMLAHSGAFDARQAVLQMGGLSAASCRDGGDACIWVRGSSLRPTVYIDERPALGGLFELETYAPHEMHTVEIYAGGRHVRAYTTWFIEREGRRGPPNLSGLFFW